MHENANPLPACWWCREEIHFDGRDFVTRDGISDSAQPRYHFHSPSRLNDPHRRTARQDK